MGFYDRVALSRMIRWTAFTGRAAPPVLCLIPPLDSLTPAAIY